MMIRTAGGPTVSPIDFNERKTPLFTRNTWIALGVVGAAHIAIGAALLYQRFELGAPVPTAEGPVIEVDMWTRPKPPPPKPAPTEPKPQPPTTRTNDTPAPTTPTDTITVLSGEKVADGTVITFDRPVDEPVADAPPAPPQPPAPAVIRNPSWISQPTGDQLMRAYPSRAIQGNIEGSASLNCLVALDGRVTDCNVTRETPGSYGFGRAAQSLSRHFRINPRTVNGAAEGSRVNINLRFNLPE